MSLTLDMPQKPNSLTFQKEMGSAIVAGIEAGWVNPVINREYSMEEVQQVLYDFCVISLKSFLLMTFMMSWKAFSWREGLEESKSENPVETT